MAAVATTHIIQVTNIAPKATIQQIRQLFGYFGTIKDLKLYPSETCITELQCKVCYVQYAEAGSVSVAQHLTNTVYHKKALIIMPFTADSIPSEAEASTYPTSALPGLASSEPTVVINEINEVNGNLFIMTIDPKLTALGLPQYPPLPAYTDPSKIEEIRRTVYVGNFYSMIRAEHLLNFVNKFGVVNYLQMAGDDTQDTRFAYVEFSNQSSVARALQNNGVLFENRPLSIIHSNNAIVKPQPKHKSTLDIDEAMKKVREAESLITAAIEPDKDKKKSKRRLLSRSQRSCSRSRSPSRCMSSSRSKSKTSNRDEIRSRSRDYTKKSHYKSHSRTTSLSTSKSRKSASVKEYNKFHVKSPPQKKLSPKALTEITSEEMSISIVEHHPMYYFAVGPREIFPCNDSRSVIPKPNSLDEKLSEPPKMLRKARSQSHIQGQSSTEGKQKSWSNIKVRSRSRSLKRSQSTSKSSKRTFTCSSSVRYHKSPTRRHGSRSRTRSSIYDRQFSLSPCHRSASPTRKSRGLRSFSKEHSRSPKRRSRTPRELSVSPKRHSRNMPTSSTTKSDHRCVLS